MAASAGVPAEDGECIGVAVVDGSPVGALSEAPETGFFQVTDPWVSGAGKIYPGNDALDGGIMEEGVDTGPQGGQIHMVFAGGVKTIDADRPRLGKKVGRQVHLNGRMDFQKEKKPFLVEDEIGAEGVVCFHTVIDLPEAFVGVKLRTRTIEFLAEKFPDDGPVRFLTDWTQR